MTPNCPASSGCSSTLIFPTRISGWSSAISSTMGDTIRQGPHQDAQKSRRTGRSLPMISCSKFSLVIFITDIEKPPCG